MPLFSRRRPLCKCSRKESTDLKGSRSGDISLSPFLPFSPSPFHPFSLSPSTSKVDVDRITQAIAAFEETLVTPNSRFDKWLKGDKKALNKTELEGYALFKDSGCVACHNGAAVGGNSFQKMGVVEPYKASSPAEGRSAVTGKDADRFNFKVPTLRNVELTYPYSTTALPTP